MEELNQEVAKFITLSYTPELVCGDEAILIQNGMSVTHLERQTLIQLLIPIDWMALESRLMAVTSTNQFSLPIWKMGQLIMEEWRFREQIYSGQAPLGHWKELRARFLCPPGSYCERENLNNLLEMAERVEAQLMEELDRKSVV